MEKVAREVKKAEAIRWMNILGVNKDIVKLFEDQTSLWRVLELPERICRLPIRCLKPRSMSLNSSGMTSYIWSSAHHLLMDGWIRCCL